MARTSPGVQRIVSILNFFADHPEQSFTLTDLVRALKLSRATCHALLTGLVEAGYLYRSHDKSYVLGPTLAAIGRVADQHSSPLQIAQPEMRALADEFDAVCSAFFRDRDVVVVRARAASVSQLGWSIPQGARMQLRAPFGAVFYAWSPQAEAEAWLDQLQPAPTAEQRATMRAGMAFMREHGFSFGVSHPGISDYPAGVSILNSDRNDYPINVASALEPDAQYRLAYVIAPVFDAGQRVAFVLGLAGVHRQVSGAQIAQMGKRLRAACERITGFIAGQRSR
jgi:DNA-binding IclR family transcriptional regulator